MKADTPEKCRILSEACFIGTSTPNGVKDLPDIFWLMGCLDWEIEAQLLEEINASPK